MPQPGNPSRRPVELVKTNVGHRIQKGEISASFFTVGQGRPADLLIKSWLKSWGNRLLTRAAQTIAAWLPQSDVLID